jgi:hypothetical protein
MADWSASEALQTCVLYSVLYTGTPLIDGRCTPLCTVHGDAT